MCSSGWLYIPKNRMTLFILSYRMYMKGVSAMKLTEAMRKPTKAVAAAASVPSSFTRTLALWVASEKMRSPVPTRVLKSADFWNKSPTPIDSRI